jgi:hypothetical protein
MPFGGKRAPFILPADFKWSDVDILHKEKNVRKREIAEMFFIKNQANTINLQKDTENLNPIYDKVISSI